MSGTPNNGLVVLLSTYPEFEIVYLLYTIYIRYIQYFDCFFEYKIIWTENKDIKMSCFDCLQSDLVLIRDISLFPNILSFIIFG